jgi:hypothetical protein
VIIGFFSLEFQYCELHCGISTIVNKPAKHPCTKAELYIVALPCSKEESCEDESVSIYNGVRVDTIVGEAPNAGGAGLPRGMTAPCWAEGMQSEAG